MLWHPYFCFCRPAPMDPLSDVLALLKPRSYMFRGFDAAGDWSLRFPPNDGIRCYAVVSGTCWLIVDGMDEPARLAAGDCIVLSRGQSFCLASDTQLVPTDALAVISKAPDGGTVSINGGGEVFGLGGFFNFAGQHASALLALLPALIHIRHPSDRATLRVSMDMMMRELRHPQPGGALVAQHLGQMLLILVLRLVLAQGRQSGLGWLSALADRQIGAAIQAMHGNPACRWTLSALARHACMSRSSFAHHFKDIVGQTPMEYLLHWRMMLAAERLTHSNDSIAAIAHAVGYESDSAFSAAFSRFTGCSPRLYARSAAFEFKSVTEKEIESEGMGQNHRRIPIV